MATSSPNATSRPECPYRGLVPFGEEDEPYFFGRSTEAEIVANNLHSARITILFGESGVGKSSLLRAAVLPALIRRARTNLADFEDPEYCPVLFHDWSGDAANQLREAIYSACRRVGVSVEHEATLDAQVESAAKACGRVLLILDQTEEYFQYHGGETWLAKLIGNKRLPLRILLSIREDALSLLDALKQVDPNIFQNTLELEHLTLLGAEEAISRPVQRYNASRAAADQVSIEPGATEKLLSQLSDDRPDGGKFVQAAYLQLVLTRWWEADSAGGVLLFDTLDGKLGGAKQIVNRYVNDVMTTLPASEQAVAEGAFTKMVTDSGRKIAQTLSELGPGSEALMSGLLGARLVAMVPPPQGSPRGEKCFKFSHDLVARAALEWRKEFRLRMDAAEKQRALDAANAVALRFRRYNRWLIATVAAAAAIAALAGAFYFSAESSKRKAQEASRESEINGLLASLASFKTTDSALWKLYRSPEEIRTAVLSRSLADASLVEEDIDRIAYAALRLDSARLRKLPAQLRSWCGKDVPADLVEALACATVMATFDGRSSSTIQFILDRSSRESVLRQLAAAVREPDPASVRPVLKDKVDRFRAEFSGGPRRGSQGIEILPWKGNEDLIGPLLETFRTALRSGSRGVRVDAVRGLADLQTQLDGDKARKIVTGHFSAANDEGLEHFPRSWIVPVEKDWRREFLEDTYDRHPSEAFFEACRTSMNWDLESSNLREGARQILTFPIYESDLKDWQRRYMAALRILAQTGGHDRAFQFLRDTSYDDMEPLGPRLVAAIAETHLTSEDYPIVAQHWLDFPDSAFRNGLLSAFARKYPEQALSFLLSRLRAAADTSAFHDAAADLAGIGVKASASNARALITEIRGLVLAGTRCDVFLPFVYKETLPDIMEIVKWPTCNERSRRNLIAAIAQVESEHFVTTRYGAPVLDWQAFVEWAERNGYQRPPTQPKFRVLPVKKDDN